MAWALKDPEGYGDYWPKGDDLGWDEQVETYVHNGMPEKEKARVCDGSVVFMSKISKKFHKDYGPVVWQESPPEYQTEKSCVNLASTIHVNNQLLAVDEALKDIIKQFEPDVHQFFPLKITMPKGIEYPVQYYIIVIRQFIEAYIPTDETLGPQSTERVFFTKDDTKKGIAKLQLSKETIGSAHLWRDTRMRRPNVFISGALQAAIAEAGLKIFRHHKVMEV
ncbi:MAG: hypothetical protein GY761_08020 [Hyphomicrobiales bacterium]|nr:hypothetical protein [Hyphomicrobiales bacterium]